jgi:small subunit ribosomal protein S17e
VIKIGNVRDTKIKKYAREISEKYPERVSLDFDSNKKLLDEVCDIYSKSMRNKIAGYIVTWLRTKNNTYENIKRELYEKKNKRKKKSKEEYGGST